MTGRGQSGQQPKVVQGDRNTEILHNIYAKTAFGHKTPQLIMYQLNEVGGEPPSWLPPYQGKT